MSSDSMKYRAFVAAAETGSLSAAATALGYTVSGAIRLVNALEKELGFKLLARNPHGVELTAEGERMLPFATQVAHSHRAAEQAAAHLRGIDTGDISIGTKHSAAALWLPRIVVAFQQKHPNIHVHIKEGASGQIAEWLGNRSVDCCLLTSPLPEHRWLPFAKTKLVAWVPANHPLAEKKHLSLQELADVPFIRTYPDSTMDFDRILAEAGIAPDVRFTTRDCFTMFSMVDAGLGVGLNVAEMALCWKGSVKVIPLEPLQELEFGLAYRNERASPAVEAFINCAEETIDRTTRSLGR